MEAQAFIYTRGFQTENDYKLMYYPSTDFCNDETRKFFRNQAKGSINTEQYQSSLEEPRWLFSRYKGMVLWGVAILNKNLCSKEFNENTDYTGRAVRGFFGIIIKDGTYNELPFDINYFSRLYSELVIPFWRSNKESFRHGGVYVNQEFSDFEVLTPRPELSTLLNSDFGRTVILGDSYSAREYLSSAMGSDKDVSLITNLQEREHAFDHSYFYCNALVDGISIQEEKKYENNAHKDMPKDSILFGDIVEQPTVDGYMGDEKPKKDFRPRVIRVVIVAALIVAAAMLVRKCKNSLSGEKVDVEQIEQTDSLKTK